DQADTDDDIWVCRNQLGSGRLAPLRVFAGNTSLDDEVASLDPAEPPHFLVEPPARRRLPSDDETDMGALVRLLRAGAPADGRSRRAEQPMAAVQSMTSSARARMDGGIVSPNALAVLRLITSSNRVGCWTGRSAGLAPLRILST